MSRESEIYRPLEARIDLDAIRRNVRFLISRLEDGCRLMAVVKANAYGHGDVEASRAALDGGAYCLGVALLEEAVKLRKAGFDCPVHLLFEPPPGRAAKIAVEKELVSTVYTRDYAQSLSGSAVGLGKTARVHIKVDTGMRRVGIAPCDVDSFCRLLREMPNLEVEGIYTHLAVADRLKDPFTEAQLGEFDRIAEQAETVIGAGLVKHAANSAGMLTIPRSHYDMVRAGITMYGLSPSPEMLDIPGLEPAMSLVGGVVLVKRVKAGDGVSYGLKYRPDRDTFIATVPVGYADGYSRVLSGNAEVLINGIRRPVVGTICMDLCMVDLGDDEVEKGTPVVLIGKDGDEEITADEIAAKLGTINYEVTCMISSRVPRTFSGSEV